MILLEKIEKDPQGALKRKIEKETGTNIKPTEGKKVKRDE